MAQSWTFGRKVGAGFAVSALTLLIVAAAGYRNIDSLIENETWVSHTQQVRRGIAELLSELKDAETGQRGFVITTNKSFLEPYQSALTEIDKTYEELRKSTIDNPEQQHRLDAARPLIDAKLAELKLTIEMRQTGDEAELKRFINAGEGKKYMDQVRHILADMDREESTLLERRRESAEASAHVTKAVILWGSLAGLVLVILIGWLIISSLTSQIGSAVGHVQSSATELQAASNQQASGAKEQVTAMSEISTTISELLATSRQIAESAQRVAKIAEETAAAARAGDSTVQKSQDSVSGIKRQVDQIVTHMLDLGRKSQQIGGVLEIINELAEQTNILAINATIEAAGAGDAGKRFAVVAEEIRKLADRVGGSTKEIRGLVEEIRAAVNSTVMATEGGSKAVDAGTRQFGDVAVAFKQIAGMVSTTTEAAREIELSTKQQSTAVEQVNTAIASVAQASRETEASTAQTLQTASQLTGLSRELARIIQPQAA